ncbi:BBE domain-containing protein [Kitasatospora sp. MMS16-BH015]|uniref:BBE domain-containing protein n=1 Tax=Kitasatospora sp. MMS16-BH015 TaxID=2018025 RepID=UPI000CF2C421|nr:BBE domain-containing protein [Kitasatospora sp. MMS16-BH015]
MRSASSRSSSTRRRAVSSRCSSSPTTDGILDLHQSDDTTRHHSPRPPPLCLTSGNTALKSGKTTATEPAARRRSVHRGRGRPEIPDYAGSACLIARTGLRRRLGADPAYVNFPDLSGWQHAYYGDNYERLTEVKRHYDPTVSSATPRPSRPQNPEGPHICRPDDLRTAALRDCPARPRATVTSRGLLRRTRHRIHAVGSRRAQVRRAGRDGRAPPFGPGIDVELCNAVCGGTFLDLDQRLGRRREG